MAEDYHSTMSDELIREGDYVGIDTEIKPDKSEMRRIRAMVAAEEGAKQTVKEIMAEIVAVEAGETKSDFTLEQLQENLKEMQYIANALELKDDSDPKVEEFWKLYAE